jgi:hypothetical protein
MKIYYAHCMAIYDTPQEERDMTLLYELFPNAEITNPNNPMCDAGAKEFGMDYFKSLVEAHDLIAFRALPNGKIPSGVWKELEWAGEFGKMIIELPCFTGREMSLDDTRFFLKEIGQR